jgi:hypothetical protein
MSATDTMNALHAELSNCSQGLSRCDCGGKVVMAYEPGCTFVHCIGEKVEKMALPDWQPKELLAKWNQRRPARTAR